MVGFDVTVDMASDDAKDPLLFYKRKVWETRVYSKRMSLFPIPQTEINRNARIVQNTGWETEEDVHDKSLFSQIPYHMNPR